MAMLRPAWMQATGGDAAIAYTAAMDRQVLGALFSSEGVLDKDANHLKVSQRGAGANFSVDIAAGGAAIKGDDVSDQGMYQVASTAIENRAAFSTGGAITAPGSGSRTHRVVAQIRDKFHNGVWTGYDWEILILQDTGSGTPGIPNSALPLGRVTIAAGQASITNANITDDRPRAAVGTPARSGTFSPVAGYAASQPSRAPSWQVNPDGWVSLGGWIERTAAATAVVFNPPDPYMLFPAGSLPAGVAPAADYRDISISVPWGSVQGQIRPTGEIRWRPYINRTLATGEWFSLDGCGFRV